MAERVEVSEVASARGTTTTTSVIMTILKTVPTTEEVTTKTVS